MCLILSEDGAIHFIKRETNRKTLKNSVQCDFLLPITKSLLLLSPLKSE